MRLKISSMLRAQLRRLGPAQPGVFPRANNILRAGLKDAGVGLGLLAIYLLVLLSPLHQAAGLQRQLETLGFTSLDTWSICGQLAKADDEDSVPVVKCVASGIGKNEVGVVPTVHVPLQFFRVASTTHYWRRAVRIHTYPPKYAGQPRAPPIAV